MSFIEVKFCIGNARGNAYHIKFPPHQGTCFKVITPQSRSLISEAGQTFRDTELLISRENCSSTILSVTLLLEFSGGELLEGDIVHKTKSRYSKRTNAVGARRTKLQHTTSKTTSERKSVDKNGAL